MSRGTVATGHVTAAMDLPTGLDTTPATAVGDRLPGGWHHDDRPPPPEAPEVIVEYTTGDPDVTATGRAVRLRLTRAVAGTATLAYATYTALERARQHRQMLTLHANAVITPGGCGVLLLGSKGAGKTSVTLALGERGFTHAGDDLAVLGEHGSELLLWPGQATAAARPRDAARWQVPKPVVRLAPFAASPSALAAVVRLTVNPAVPSPLLVNALPFSINEQLRLHEALARQISGLPTPLSGPAGAPYGRVWNIDTPALAHWRTHLISRLGNHRYLYLYAPDPDSAADLITREMTT
ncbi:hypothetical protein SAMN05216223_13147 [Actinacidiphila yanglinensis]|uniref:Uncharacterized protein n=1 Tax=Actinacidiphila yanglinensis TaxID=310779 RepID=A0A1H6EAN6_9ACTN|nr:hypothetical protein [Actinacidiphila yanglinensis]SEG94860.1 hypothetical protein SAMN05216223_13147 [Actinacidiphila yanglinensis]